MAALALHVQPSRLTTLCLAPAFTCPLLPSHRLSRRSQSSFAPLGAPRQARFLDTRQRGQAFASESGLDLTSCVEIGVAFRDIDRFQHVSVR